jgi:hypothetical protein
LDRSRTGLVVRIGTVGAGADDREVHCGVTVFAEQRGEIDGHLVLGTAGEADAENLLEGRVGTGPGGREPRQFVLVLDRAQHRQTLGEADVAGARERSLQTEQVHRPGRVRDRVAAVWVKQPAGGGIGVGPVAPVHHGQAERR